MRATIGQYEVKYELGRGAFGVVYAAVDAELGRWVAIKELHREISTNPALVERFRAEAISLAKLNHPNITALYHLLHPQDEWFLIMELVQGQTLDKVLHRLQRLDLTEALAIIVQTAAGLGYANRMGVIHRDIKPSNLMLTDTGQVKIMDFGIARIRGTQRLTKSGLLGTYAYLAPEQFRGGEGTEQSDMYALACVAYEMLSGNIPFDAPTEAEMMRGHLELPARSLRDILPGLDPAVDDAIQRALAKDPAARFANVEEFSDALGGALIERQAQEIVRTRILSRMPPPSRPTTLSVLQPEPVMPVPSPGSIGSFGGGLASGVVAKSTLSRRMPAIVLGGAVTGVVVVTTAIMFQDKFTSDPTPRQPAAIVNYQQSGDSHVRELSGQTPSGPSPADPSSGKQYTDFVPPAKSPGGSSFGQGSETENDQGFQFVTADTLISQAESLISSGQITDAEVKLRTVTEPPYNDSRALVRLAHLDDPTQPGRPPSFAADARQAARYYQEAEERHDTSAHADRERLREYLQDEASRGDIDAKVTLRQFWP
ncbi:MAG: serine/threonine-protein kinase [Acetobacteraceae bacterium]|jgi:serine/threonine protein kinase